MREHTPGPWKVFDGHGASKDKPIIVDSIPDIDGKCMANCICYLATTNDDFAANAKLIAAAPDLLAACKAAEGWIDVSTATYDKPAILEALRAAIDRAGGAR